jgi:hypothetical protein
MPGVSAARPGAGRAPRGVRAILVLLGLGAVAAVATLRAVRTFPGFSISGDALQYGELGRNLAAGVGFVSGFVYPISLAYPALRVLPQPHFLYHPAYPTVLAGMFSVLPADDATIVWTNVVLAWLLLPIVYALAFRLGGPMPACVATVAMALDTTLAANVRNGGTEVLTMVCVTAAALLLVPPLGRTRAALAGAVLGIAYLTRPNLAVLLPLAIWPVWTIGARAAIVPLLAGGLVVMAPWVARGWLVVGQPGFSLYTVANFAFETPSSPGTMATYGTLTPRSLAFMVAHHPAELAAKVGSNVLYYARQAPFTVSPLIVLAFALSLLLGRRSAANDRREAARALGWWTVAAAVVTVLVAAPVAREPRYLAPFAPVLVVLGIVWALDAVAAHPRRRVLAIVTVAALLVLPLAATARDVWRGRPAPARWHDPNLARVAALTRADDVIVSDVGRAVTWYARRWSLQAPIDRATLEHVDRELLPVSAIYLSATAPARFAAMYGTERFDAAAYVPEAFVPVAEFSDGGRLWRKR